MTTSSEDVLLQISEVRYKKGDGTLYIMNERVAWMLENRDKVVVSHMYQDIKMQKISPEGKPKVQLQVVLHDGSSTTFHFVNRNGVPAQIADRDKIKELLQQLLPNFKRKVDKELEEKNKILVEQPNLLQLYKDLVITQVITSEEFWDTHAKSYTQPGGQKPAKQEIGVSGAFLADIKPQTDGCNGLKYNLTVDIVDSIFKAYPAVERKHRENVPAKLSESEFWTKFFQSHYFHRDRINAGTKDLFTECARIDDQALRQAVATGAGDVLFDIQRFGDNSLQDGFGGAISNRNGVNSGNIVHQSLIKRFNQHSTMVLNTCTTPVVQSEGGAAAAADVSKKSDAPQMQPTATAGEEAPAAKRARIEQKIFYDDLSEQRTDAGGGGGDVVSTQLELSKVERYLFGPVAGNSNTGSAGCAGMNGGDGKPAAPLLDVATTAYAVLQERDAWNARTPHKVLVSATAAVNALGELSPGGALMRGFLEQSLAQLVRPDVEKELRHLYLSLNELLKHFWHAFPPLTADNEATLQRMHDAIRRFHVAKVKPFEEHTANELSPLGGAPLTKHLNQMMQTAFRKYDGWQERHNKAAARKQR